MTGRRRVLAALALTLGSAAGAAPPPSLSRPAGTALASAFYPRAVHGEKVLATALEEARTTDRLAVIVFGADWCHDSRALAEVLTSAPFAGRFAERFAVTFIDVGSPQTGQGRNLDLAARYGATNLKSTPALFVIAPDGRLLNSTENALGWRNADSRSAEEILAWFDTLARRNPRS